MKKSEYWCWIYISYAMLSSRISWNISQVTLLSQYTQRPLRKCAKRKCIPRKLKWQVGYDIVYNMRTLHKYFIPNHKNAVAIECTTTAFPYSDWL